VSHLEGGDTMHARDLVRLSEKDRDASYVRVSQTFIANSKRRADIQCIPQYTQLVDINQARRNADPVYRPQDFYGQLRNIVVIDMPAAEELKTTKPETHILTAIQNLKVMPVPGSGNAIQYKDSAAGHGPLEVVDLATIQCGIGRVLDHGHWVIVDRSGPFAQASFRLDG
jgi:hypothetical protein